MLKLSTLVFLLLAPAAEPDTALKPFQGTWVIAEANLAGRDHIDDFGGMKLAITGDKYVINFGKNSEKGTLKIDATKAHKRIDLTTAKGGPFKGRNLPGIYEFKGDTLIICLNSEKPDRPTTFDAPEKTPMMLLTYKREKK